jgi:hypothetical protein
LAALTALVTALVAAPAASTASTGTLDQAQESISSACYGPVLGAGQVAQGFTVGESGRLEQADLYLEDQGAGTGHVTVEVRGMSADGYPDATVLASAVVDAGQLPAAGSGGGWVSFPFGTPAQIVGGSTYALVTYTTDGAYYDWDASCSDPYAGGVAYYTAAGDPPSWQAYSNADLAFRTYVSTTPTIADMISTLQALSLPAGLTQSLVAKLQNAQATLTAGDLSATCGRLTSFANELAARSGKAIAAASADALIAEEQTISDSLGC